MGRNTKYAVEVTYTQTKTITVWAPDEASAAEKAEEIVSGWQGVESAEAGDVEEAG